MSSAKPQAVPTGLSITSAVAGSIACFLLFGGTICLAIATETEAASRRSRILGGREWVRLGAVEMGLDCLRRYLQGLPVYERIDFEKT